LKQPGKVEDSCVLIRVSDTALEISKLLKPEVIDQFLVFFWVYTPCGVNPKEYHQELALCGSSSAYGLGQLVTDVEGIPRDLRICSLKTNFNFVKLLNKLYYGDFEVFSAV
jgi:hypothetical protein